MAYVLRFVQRFRPEDEAAFMALEAWTEVYEVLDFPQTRPARRARRSRVS